MSRNTIVANATGLAFESGAALESFGDNRVAGNTVDGSPTATLAAAPPASPPPATPPPAADAGNPSRSVPAAMPTAAAPRAMSCRVPRLTSLTLSRVRRVLTRAHCRLGKVRFRIKHGEKRDRVYAQSRRAGMRLTADAKISVTVSAREPRRNPRAKAAVGGATRTWVSGVGDDLNPCSRTAPCNTFAGALGRTADGGTIDVLDSGSFGPVTITRAVTIDGAGQSATVLAPGGNGILVNAGAGHDVILRNLTVISVPGCSAPGAGDGIRLLSGGALHLENVTARGFAGAGVALQPSADEAVTVHGGDITDNCTAGISAQRPGGTVDVTVDHVTLSNDGTGVLAGDGSLLRLTENMITGNSTGLATAGSGVIQSWGDDRLAGNTANGDTPVLLKFI